MKNLTGKTVFITGGSRGIGRSLAIRCGRAGANVVIAAKSADPHPILGGSIYTVAEEITAAGGNALPLQVDVRDEQQIIHALAETADHFSGIDILVNNAGAIHLGNVQDTSLKQYDLIQAINHRATFIAAKHALPYLKKSSQAHILSFAPPINLAAHWLGQYAPYALSKYGMTLLTLGLAEELKNDDIQCNTLWPVTLINTAAVSVKIGEVAARQFSRKPEMISDAAFAIISGDCGKITGQTLLDEDALRLAGIRDFSEYACSPEHANQLAKDLFVD
ncbi:SDR family oxidoreductase [Acinetobacter guerrae]|uniref:SDR family oxidoreductase n=1 Tax=Acinetobacter guerrae TaxID=1843371 RepID=UPI00125ECBA7|nr:NAD(P)-dependent oxidoreductase [Acinetobacter guerrae]